MVQRFVADIGVPRAFRTDNGAEYTNSTFVEYCSSLQIRRELTAPYTPQQNGPVESGLSRAIKVGHAARIEVNRLFPDVHLEKLKGGRDPDGSSLWASEGFNPSATTPNSGMLSPHEVFFGSRPPMPVLPFCKPAYHRVPRQSNLGRQAHPCYYVNFGYNHGSDCFKVWMRKRGGSCTRVTSHGTSRGNRYFPRPRQQDRACPSHRPMLKCRTTCTSTRLLPLLIRPLPRRCLRQITPPAPLRNPTASSPDRVVRELGHQVDVRMSGHTRGETRATQESPHSMGLMSHAALAQGIANK